MQQQMISRLTPEGEAAIARLKEVAGRCVTPGGAHLNMTRELVAAWKEARRVTGLRVTAEGQILNREFAPREAYDKSDDPHKVAYPQETA